MKRTLAVASLAYLAANAAVAVALLVEDRRRMKARGR